MFFKMFFIKVKKHVFYVFYLQINVFIIYGLNNNALRVLLSRDKRSESDDKQSRQYVSDCVSRVYRLLSALVLVALFMN